jgi:hypothetical protein
VHDECYFLFWTPYKQKIYKILKKYINEKNISENLGNCLRLVEEDQNIKD